MLKSMFLKTVKLLGLALAIFLPTHLYANVPLGNSCTVSKPGDSHLNIGSFRHILEHEYNAEINCFDEVKFNSSATINTTRTHEIFNSVEHFKEYVNPDMNNIVGKWQINGNGHNIVLDATTNSFDSFWPYAMLIRVYDSTVTLKDITIRVDECKNAVKIDTQAQQIFKQKYPDINWKDNLPPTTLVFKNFRIESNDGLNPDNDPFCGNTDLCPNDASDTNLDSDNDGNGDVCDICEDHPDDVDSDNDGVPNGCDICEDHPDDVDSDNDGVPNGCDICPGGNDNVDTDNDGVPNGCDICPGGDDNKDTDGDGKPDSCDPCPYSKWTDICDLQDIDSDGDGVPDSGDNCPNISNPNQVDWDMDGVGDACDVCIGFDDNVDTDGDFQPDGCDVCEGADDFIDLNNNGTPDGCDDADGDGVPDKDDICPDGDDNIDEDNDGTPDACQDDDGDGVNNPDDQCPGFDDNVDANNNGIPDDCEDDDQDGVPNKDDICPDGDDNIDEDNDGTPDACQETPIGGDDDGDGVPNDQDICPNGDDGVDFDGDQIPDDCDNCPLVSNSDQDPEACQVPGNENPLPGDDLVTGENINGAGCSLGRTSSASLLSFAILGLLIPGLIRKRN